MLYRARRIRGGDIIRRMVRETRIDVASLVYPMFIVEGSNIKEEINSMPGQYRYSKDRCFEKIDELLSVGVRAVLLFGIPEHKDEIGSAAYHDHGVVQEAVKAIKEKYADEVYVITDVCMCEYTSHGHCGIIDNFYVDNDATLPSLAKISVSHAKAGADMIAPSDMMDGRVKAIREALDGEGFKNIPIMSYSTKYASAFYGPFRDAAGSAPAYGDRKSYQMDVHNAVEGVKEALQDVTEGADILMVKPAMAYLDVLYRVKEATKLPVATYSVSGEYAMVKAASKLNYLDEERIMCEMAVAAYRAGADIYITYYAKELAECIKKGLIG